MTTNNGNLIEQARRRSVQEGGDHRNVGMPLDGQFVFSLATIADSIPAWGGSVTNVRNRDVALRRFWPTEPILASAIYSMVIRNASFHWTLRGPAATVETLQDALHMSDLGRGWRSLMLKTSTDIFTQDNGAFWEVVRQSDNPTSPVVNIAHLDAGRCTRTGDPEIPVIYRDIKGRLHNLKWYQVITLEEFPSPVETMNGVGLCAVSRVLRAAQLLRDIGIYMREKIGGSNPNEVNIVSGINSQTVSDAIQQHMDNQAAAGFQRYIKPLIMGTIDPSQDVSLETIAIKAIPDGFDLDLAMKWYINQLALGFGADYQDFAPLPGGNLGTSNQSQILHQKSRGKGPAAFMQMVEYKFNFAGVIPQNVTFEYDEPDVQADQERADLFKAESEAIEVNVRAGVLSPQAGTQILLDKGFIGEEIAGLSGLFEDVTTDVTAGDDVPIENKGRYPKRTRRRRRKPKREDDKDFTAFESRPAFGEDLTIDAEDEYLATIERAFAETLDDFERRIGTKGLRRYGVKQENPEDVFLDGTFWAAFRERMEGAAQPFARKVALEAASLNAEVGLSVNFDLVNQRVLDFSRTYSNAWYEGLEQTTRKQLQSAITQWQETGLGRRGLPDLVDAIRPTFGKSRAELIAANETTVIFDQGNNLAHIAAGITEEEWQTSEDGAVEEICIALNGQRFPVSEGPRPVRDTHIGCRCARLPVGSTGEVIRR